MTLYEYLERLPLYEQIAVMKEIMDHDRDFVITREFVDWAIEWAKRKEARDANKG